MFETLRCFVPRLSTVGGKGEALRGQAFPVIVTEPEGGTTQRKEGSRGSATQADIFHRALE